jgi:hypothetical protein
VHPILNASSAQAAYPTRNRCCETPTGFLSHDKIIVGLPGVARGTGTFYKVVIGDLIHVERA